MEMVSARGLPRCLRLALLWPVLLVASSKYTDNIWVDKWYGRTIYFLIVDRFALTDTDDAPQCGIFNHTHHAGADVSRFCGGTLKGIIRKLDYIQDMGFDAIWITPVVKQVPWVSQYGGLGYDGYYAMDWFQIDPHFGTEQDLLDLGHELRKREMLFMMDSVVNHAGPTWTLEQIKQMPAPWNDLDGRGFNQLFRKPYETFGQYLSHPNLGIQPNDCHWPGNFFCGYNETIDHTAWKSFSDINQSYKPAGDYLLRWIKWYVKKYNFDGMRLDTVVDVDVDFIGEWQRAAGIFILGEVMVPENLSYHASFQNYVTGMTNMPIVYQWANSVDRSMVRNEVASETFENDVWDVWQKNKTSFAHLNFTLQQQLELCANVHLLGNFVDSHDTSRFLFKHKGDVNMLMNALVFVFMWHGLPIVYQGTEDPQVSRQSSERAGMWYQSTLQPPYSQTDIYKFIRALNKVRRQLGFGFGGKYSTANATALYADEILFVFRRGDALVAISNGKNNTSPALCMNTSQLPQGIKDGCEGHGVDVIFGQAHQPQCHKFPVEQLCIMMRVMSVAIFVAAPPPKAVLVAQKSIYFMCLGAVIFAVMPLGFFAWGKQFPQGTDPKALQLNDEEAEEGSSSDESSE